MWRPPPRSTGSPCARPPWSSASAASSKQRSSAASIPERPAGLRGTMYPMRLATVQHPDYPSQYEVDVLLKDGSTVHLRPVRTEDAGALRALFERMSPHSLYLRYHRPMAEISEEEVRRFTDVDYEDTFALAATLGEPPDERIIAVGLYSRIESDSAEVAFTVEDSHQGRGIATQLLDQLAVAAREHGIHTFEADVLGENRSMMDVFRDSGFPVESRIKYGTYHVAFPIEQTEEASERASEREAWAAAASVRALLEPKSVAVIGASRQRGTIGAEIFHNVLRHGYTGVVYPVNPKARAVGGVKAFASILDIPDAIDLAIIAVPAEHVLEIADECAKKRVRGMAGISAGFREP